MHSRTNSGESNRIHQPTIAELPLGMQSITRAAAFGTSTENNTGPTNSHVTSAANAKKKQEIIAAAPLLRGCVTSVAATTW